MNDRRRTTACPSLELADTQAPQPGVLPPPPRGKSGWPWTRESPQLPDTMPGGLPWPRVTIITPSYNQAQFIEETIRSVLLQGYTDLEYIIIDGGSTDGSVEIIRKYADELAYWVSEPDRGQSHAINKGLRRATGDILAWLNSDDTYFPGTLGHVAASFGQLPQVGLLFGSAVYVDEKSKHIGVYQGVDRPFFRKLQYWRGWEVPQPTLFFRRETLNGCGGLDESFNYALDYEWVIRASRSTLTYCTDAVLSTYRLHGDSKTGTWDVQMPLFHKECARAVRKLAPRGSRLFWQWQAIRLADQTRRHLYKAMRAAEHTLMRIDR